MNIFKSFRQSKRMSQAEAGKLLGISSMMYGELERGKIKGSKQLGFELALKHIDNPEIYSEITESKINELKRKGVSLSQISIKMGHSEGLMSGILNGHKEKSKKFTVLFNAVYFEIKSASQNRIRPESLVIPESEFVPVKHSEPVSEPSRNQGELIKFDKSKLRIETVNGEPWFCLLDICKAIDYTTISHSLLLIEVDDLQKLQVLNHGKDTMMWFTSESGLYQFLLSSNVPKAKQFRKWVTSEVLPSIRKTGSYQTQQAQLPQASMPAWAESMMQILGSETIKIKNDLAALEEKTEQISQLAQKVDVISKTMPDFEDMTEETVNRVFRSFQSLDVKKAELKQLVRKIVYLASKLPKNDPLFRYATFPATYNDVYLFATPLVSSISGFVSVDQIQASIDRAIVILKRLGGNHNTGGQMGIDFDEKN